MATIGEKIRAARTKRGMTGEELGRLTGMTKAAISQIETDKRQQVDLDILCRIADALDDISILTHHCQGCPVRNMAFIRHFPELNNIRRHDPSIIANKLRIELEEAAASLNRLSERFIDADFKTQPDYMAVFVKEMEQVIDAKRCIEILEYELVLGGTHSSADLKKVYDRQQEKCIERGHHKPENETV
ncbi:MAG: helix-turn-helix domain-containing protein [Desulfobulbia bacterium]